MKTIYEDRKRVTREMAGSTHTLPILIEYAWSMARVWLEYGWSMARVWLEIATPRFDCWSENAYTHCTGGQIPCEVNHFLRNLMFLLLMVTVGVNDVWGQVTPSTSSAPVYYLIQSTQCDAYYMRPNGSGTNVNAMNILTNDVRWYFVNADTDTETGTQYYYIVNNTGKYMYFARPDRDGDNRTYIELQTFNDENKDKFKFSIAEYNSSGTYNIIPKGNTDSYCLNKQGSITSDNNIQLANGFSDSGSLWKLIPASTFSFESPVRATTGWYYKIQNSDNTSFYIKDVGGKGGGGGSTYDNPAVTSNDTDETEVAKMKVHFVAANTDDALVTYYYIIAEESNRYLYYRANSRNTDNATLFKNYASGEDERYRFMIVKGYNGSYNIISKYCTHDNGANISALKKVNDNNNRILSSQGGRNEKAAEWNFITLTQFCETPTITFNNATNKVTISTTTSGATIYYTMGDNPDDPTSTLNDGSGVSGSSTVVIDDVTSPTTIKAIATKDSYMDSDVAEKTITKVATPTIDFNDETYTITLESETTGSTIYYRIGETGDFTQYENPFVVGPGNTVEAYATKDGCINSETNSYVAPDFCVPPVFTVTESTITITCSTTGSRIYYTEDGTDPDLDPEATVKPTLYEAPISATERKIIKAIAVCDLDQSGVVTLFNRPAIVLSENAEKAAAGIVLSDDTYSYDGTAKEPYVMMVAIKQVPVAAAEYSVLFSDNTEAGTATVTLTDADDENNIVIENASTTFTINKAPLTVIADDKNIAYGGTAPAYTVSYKGFVNDETATAEGVITTTPTATCTYVTGNDAGTYPIIPSGGVAKNYSLVYHNGTLTVGPKVVKDDPDTEAGESQITIVLKEDDNVVTGDTYTYDGTAKEPTVTVKVGDNVIAASEYTVAYTHNTNAGSGATGPTVTITDKAGGNYAVSGVKTFTINKASLTVKANNVSAIYGSMPVYTFSYTGFIEGETAETAITTPPTVSCEYPSVHNDVGTYDIIPNGGEAPNYELTYVEGACKGTLTVGPRTVKDNPDTEAGEGAVTIELSGIPEDGYVYDGTAKEPTVTVKDGDTVIDAGEYTVGYSDNTNAGTATVTITDKTGGNYIVSGETTFDIHPTSIGDGIQPATGYTVSEPTKTGNTYSVTVKEGETPLTQDVDYELVASPVSNATYTVYDNEIASIMVKGKGNYGGSVLRISGTLTYWSSGETGDKQNVSPFVATEANLDSPDGVTPYIISGINMTKHELKLKAVSYIPKDVPVLLLTGALADPDGDGKKTASFIPMPKEVEEGGEEDTSMNLLKVSEDQIVGAGQTYALYHGKFWLTSSGTLTEGKFYFDNPNYQSTTETVSSAPPMRLVFEDMTGVEEVRRMMDDGRNDRWYTLDGRQLQGKPAKKGLYIKNGRKMVVME